MKNIVIHYKMKIKSNGQYLITGDDIFIPDEEIIKINKGYWRISGGNKSPAYQKNTLKELGATNISRYQNRRSGTKKNRIEWRRTLDGLEANDILGVTEISRMTHLGYDEFKQMAKEVWEKNARLIITEINMEINNDNIHLFKDEAEKAIEENYQHQQKTIRGIKMKNKIDWRLNNNNAGIKKEIIEQIIEYYKIGVKQIIIAKKLNLDKNTVNKYIKQYKEKCGDKGGLIL